MIDPLTLRREPAADSRLSEWRAPDGWRHRRFDWPHPDPRGRILVQGGRADIIEKFYETIAHLHDAGWSVTAFDWRGQGGSGRLAADPHVGHAASFDPWVADLGDFWRGWRDEGPGPAMLLAHSMGAHLALRALLDGGIDPAAMVLVAPMIGIRSPVGTGAGTRVARLMTRLGDPARPAWKVRSDAKSAGHRQQLLTHSVERYADEAYWYDRDPSLRLGPPSWAWVLEAFVSGARLERDSRLGGVTTPILMLVAEADGLVDPAAALRLAGKLPNVELVRFGAEAAHELLREDDAVRTRAYAAIDAFLEART
ncbi:alpha/beta hydrolase [Sphingomonas sp. RP10(2022)]|uniref:Alpha/beta hydrolase n=1 Tax=Sphingomonas liriopis TaxID=2949094 RepID=A0A9X2HX52_9SPHN|nr:alpha/beta fold hydrolase [Sphingomonas liriopis]MCP3735198.1 alpha/beta hydrolase [Sphingomonas liriopis]